MENRMTFDKWFREYCLNKTDSCLDRDILRWAKPVLEIGYNKQDINEAPLEFKGSQSILDQLKQEKQRREDAEKALEFYAEKKNWRKDSQDFGSSMSNIWQISGNDLYEQNEATQYGGATAKEHFEKYKQ